MGFWKPGLSFCPGLVDQFSFLIPSVIEIDCLIPGILDIYYLGVGRAGIRIHGSLCYLY